MELLFVVVIAVLAINIKWIFITLLFPFMIINERRKTRGILWKIAAAPYLVFEHIAQGGIIRYAIINIGFIPSNELRKWMYKALGCKIEKNVVIHYKTEIRSPKNLFLGKGTIIGDNAILDARSGLTLGQNVNLSSNVSIYTLQHDHRDPNFACNRNRKSSVEIDDRVWLGSNVIVLPGVHIGEGAVCCAGCVVTKDVEPYSVVAGIPAKKVSERSRDLIYEFNGKTCWFY